MRTIEEPVVTKEDGKHWDETERHPAFGVIGASRVSSTGHNLFQSDFQHRGFVVIKVMGAELHRGLSRDWVFARDTIVEVAVSEAQWATFVSTLNVGDGVPCTITARQGVGLVPGLPHRDEKDKFAPELQKTLEEAASHLKELEKLPMSAKAHAQVEKAIKAITDSAPWVAKVFGEHVEEKLEKAKSEIGAWVTSTIQRAGLAALGSEAPVAFLEAPTEKTED